MKRFCSSGKEERMKERKITEKCLSYETCSILLPCPVIPKEREIWILFSKVSITQGPVCLKVFNSTCTVKSIQLMLDIIPFWGNLCVFWIRIQCNAIRGLILLYLQLQRISYFAYIYKCVLVPYWIKDHKGMLWYLLLIFSCY